MNVNFKVAKSQFFDRPLAKSLDRATYSVLLKFGAYVRRSAKSSLKMARQKRVGELTPDERQSYQIRLDISKRKGTKKPRRPDVISKPGDPPKLHTRPKSPLREAIEFIYDPAEKAVLIGPEASRETQGAATQALEHGGTSLAKSRGRQTRVRVAARPFMEPAYRKELPNLAKWRNTVK